jgi:hypothetical protein
MGSDFGPRALRTFERIASLLAIGLAARQEARIFGKPEDYLPPPSYFHIGMLMHRLVLAGRATFAQAWSDDELIEAEARRLSPALGRGCGASSASTSSRATVGRSTWCARSPR